MVSYKDISIRKFIKLQEIINETKELDELAIQAKLIAVINDMTEDEVLSLRLTEYGRKASELSFLEHKPELKGRVPDKIMIGDRKFEVIKDPKRLSTAQYIDFQTLLKMDNPDKYLPNLLACFIIPYGKNYGEYDIMEIADYFADNMDVQQGLELLHFFQLRSLRLISNTVRYLELRMKRAIRKEKDKETKEKLKEGLNKMEELLSLINTDGYTMLISQQRHKE